MKAGWKSDSHLKLGKRGEEAAVRYLYRKRYHIIARNYGFRGGEIDIVARRGDFLVFVEVKTRISQRFGRPAEAVTREKAKKIIQTVSHFCQKYNLSEFTTRLDVIEVEFSPRRFFFDRRQITHIQNAIEADSSF